MAKLSTPVPAAIVAIAVVVVAGALHIAAVAALPIVASVLLCLLLWPLRQWLDARVPRGVAAALSGALLVLALAAVIGWGWYAVSTATDEFRSSREKYVQQYEQAREWLTGSGIPRSTIPELNDANVDSRGDTQPDSSARNENQPLLRADTRREIAAIVLGGLRNVIGAFFALLLTIFLAILVLYEGDRWASWARDKFTDRQYATIADLATIWSQQTRWYLLGKTAGGSSREPSPGSGSGSWAFLSHWSGVCSPSS